MLIKNGTYRGQRCKIVSRDGDKIKVSPILRGRKTRTIITLSPDDVIDSTDILLIDNVPLPHVPANKVPTPAHVPPKRYSRHEIESLLTPLPETSPPEQLTYRVVENKVLRAVNGRTLGIWFKISEGTSVTYHKGYGGSLEIELSNGKSFRFTSLSEFKREYRANRFVKFVGIVLLHAAKTLKWKVTK